MTIINWVLLFILVGGVIAIAFYYLYSNKNKKKFRILLFEKIGNNKQYRGARLGIEKYDKKLGYYIFIKKEGINIESPSSEEFVPSKNMNTLMVCKYATDDYRVITLLKDNEFFHRKKELLFEESIEEGEDGDSIIIKTPKIDKDTEEQDYEYVDVPYKEPLGITQTGKEIMRFNRIFKDRMDELSRGKQSFWDKYGNVLVNIAVITIFVLFTFIVYQKSIERDKYWADKFYEVSGEYVEEIKNPSFIENIMKAVDRRQAEADAPPS